MKLEEFSVTGIYCMIICVLWSEANDTICKREYTITDQITFTVDKACEWTVNASDSSAILLFTAQRQGNNVQLCDTGDIIKVLEDISGDVVATLLQINCSRSYPTERVFSSTSKVKVTARGTAAVVNMTFTEYKKQHFTTSHEGTTWLDAQVGCEVEGGTIVTDENYWQAKYSPLVKFMLLNGVREVWVGKLFTITEKECVKVNSTFFTSSKGIMVKTMQTCAIQCSEYDFFAFHRTKCYCLDDSPGVLSLERDCTYPCPGSLGELCGGPNTITLYSLELCGQTYVDYYGSFSFTKSGKNECNWTISVASHVSVNVSVVMGTSLESCRNHNLSIFTPTALIADSRQSLCKSGNIKISGLGPVFIHLTTDGTKPTTVDVRWYTNTTSDSTLTTDENKIALYVPVTITSCVIVAAAIFVTICLRQKRAKKNPKRKVNENIYSYTTTEIQAQNSTPSDPKCELGEYIEVHNQSPRSAAYVIPMGQDASNQEYHTLHQRLEPTYSDPQENVYNDTKKPSSVYGQYDISTVSTFTKNSSNKSQAMTDNVYNTCISRDGPCGDYDSQYDVSSASAFNKSSGKSKGQTDNVYNTFQTPDDTEYSETTFHTKEKETLPTDNEYGVVKRQT